MNGEQPTQKYRDTIVVDKVDSMYLVVSTKNCRILCKVTINHWLSLQRCHYHPSCTISMVVHNILCLYSIPHNAVNSPAAVPILPTPGCGISMTGVMGPADTVLAVRLLCSAVGPKGEKASDGPAGVLRRSRRTRSKVSRWKSSRRPLKMSGPTNSDSSSAHWPAACLDNADAVRRSRF